MQIMGAICHRTADSLDEVSATRYAGYGEKDMPVDVADGLVGCCDGGLVGFVGKIKCIKYWLSTRILGKKPNSIYMQMICKDETETQTRCRGHTATHLNFNYIY